MSTEYGLGEFVHAWWVMVVSSWGGEGSATQGQIIS